MKYLVIISTLFVIGSLFGWVLELFFRRFVSQKRWVNPGFLVGPYLPIYGFGVICLFAVSNISFGINIEWLDILVHILLIGILMTVVEFIAGLIFIKGLHVKLWDYSNRKGNIMGIICPTFSLAWLAVGSIYFFFINPYLVQVISWISENLIYTFFIGGVVGMMVVDFAYSLHLGLKIKQFAELQSQRFDQVKKELQRRVYSLTKKNTKAEEK